METSVFLLTLLMVVLSSAQEYAWVRGDSMQEVPWNGVIGGYGEFRNIVLKQYIARALHKDELVPGKLSTPKLLGLPQRVIVYVIGEHELVATSLNGGDFHYVYNDAQHWSHNFEVLVGAEDNFHWYKMDKNKVLPKNAIIGGHKIDGTVYYIGRVKHDGRNKEVGKIDSSNKILYTSMANETKLWDNYEILVWETKYYEKMTFEIQSTAEKKEKDNQESVLLRNLMKKFKELSTRDTYFLNSVTINACKNRTSKSSVIRP